MPPSLHPDLHTEKCNKLIEILKKCRDENKYMQLLGACNDAHYAVARCIKQERKDAIDANSKKRLSKVKDGPTEKQTA